jgi:hypothetical protein
MANIKTVSIKNKMVRNLNKVASLINWENQDYTEYINFQVELIKLMDTLADDLVGADMLTESKDRAKVYEAIKMAEESGKETTSYFFNHFCMEDYITVLFIEVLELTVIEFKNEVRDMLRK